MYSASHLIIINTSLAQANTSSNNNNITKMSTLHPWISKKNNLNISIKIDPQTPIVDKDTKITFQVKKLNDAIPANFAKSVKVTMVNSDGEIFKFPKQNITNKKAQIIHFFNIRSGHLRGIIDGV